MFIHQTIKMRVLVLLLALPAAHALMAASTMERIALKRPLHAHRSASAVALYEDDPWLESPERKPLSKDSIEVLFKYGPVVYGNRVWQPEEYNASIRKFMDRWPEISRELAEQEIHEFIADSTGYMARTTAESYKGPKESELKPPVGIMDKALVVAWVAILIPAAGALTQLSLNAPPVDSPGVVQMMDMEF
jgi:hypothetical protein